MFSFRIFVKVPLSSKKKRKEKERPKSSFHISMGSPRYTVTNHNGNILKLSSHLNGVRLGKILVVNKKVMPITSSDENQYKFHNSVIIKSVVKYFFST